MSDARTVLGVLLSGAALVMALVVWPDRPLVGIDGVTVPTVFALGLLAFLSFSARRHGMLPGGSPLLVAAVAGLGMAVGGGILLLAISPGSVAAIAVGVIIVLGIGCAILGITEALDMPFEEVAIGSRILLLGGALGFGGLFVAGAVGGVADILTGDALGSAGTFGIAQLGIAIGFIGATAGFVLGTGRGLSYLDMASPGRRDVQYMVGGTIIVIGVAALVQLVLVEFGVVFAEHDVERRAREDGPAILFVAIAFAFVTNGLGEELLYRNGVQKYLSEWFHPASAILLGSVIFAAIHIPGYGDADPFATVGSLLVVFVLAIILGIAYERTGNVLVPIVIHGSYNALVWLLAYVRLFA